MGVEASTAPATPARQSRASISATALGRVSALVEGKTARATPAASATGSAPATRVVFLVAMNGSPRLLDAPSSSPLTVWLGEGSLPSPSSLPLPPHPAAATASRQARARAARRIGPNGTRAWRRLRG